jgi:hypothetical protein
MLELSVALAAHAALILSSAQIARPAAPSVLPADYPALVECTLAKRAEDIEAMFVAQDRHHEQATRKHGLYAPRDRIDAVEVTTTNGGTERAARLFVQIVETCHKLEVGRPLGFWSDQLVSDWRRRMGMPWGLEGNDLVNEADFARCLRSFRPQLVQEYLSEVSGSARRAIFKSFFEQVVCRTRYPLAIKESRLRRHLGKN